LPVRLELAIFAPKPRLGNIAARSASALNLERKLADFQVYYNAARCHASLEGYAI